MSDITVGENEFTVTRVFKARSTSSSRTMTNRSTGASGDDGDVHRLEDIVVEPRVGGRFET